MDPLRVKFACTIFIFQIHFEASQGNVKDSFTYLYAIWLFNLLFKSDHCRFTRNILKHFVCGGGFPSPSPHFATKCMILNKKQLPLTWLYFLTPKGGCESELMFLKHFARKIIAAAYRFACYSSSFWLTMHFCAPHFLCVCHCAVLAITKVCFLPRTLSENKVQVHILTAIPKDQVPAAHFMPYILLKCLAGMHGLMYFPEELRAVDSVSRWAN